MQRYSSPFPENGSKSYSKKIQDYAAIKMTDHNLKEWVKNLLEKDNKEIVAYFLSKADQELIETLVLSFYQTMNDLSVGNVGLTSFHDIIITSDEKAKSLFIKIEELEKELDKILPGKIVKNSNKRGNTLLKKLLKFNVAGPVSRIAKGGYSSTFSVGSRIKHPALGEGEVTGQDGLSKIDVRFDDGSTKRLIVEHAVKAGMVKL